MNARAKIGAMRRKFVIEGPSDVADDVGGFSQNWTARASVWGHATVIAGNEAFAAARTENALTHRIRIRWRPDIDASCRIRDGDRIFAIIAITDADGRRRFVNCLCREYE